MSREPNGAAKALEDLRMLQRVVGELAAAGAPKSELHPAVAKLLRHAVASDIREAFACGLSWIQIVTAVDGAVAEYRPRPETPR